MAGIKVEADIVKLERKISPQAFLKGQRALANQFGADTNRFVPKKRGSLRSSQVIASDGSNVQWVSPYAHRQFMAPNGWHYSTPGTGPRWTDVAKNSYMSKWTNAFKKGAGL